MYTTLISCKKLQQYLGRPDWVIVDCRFSLADTESGRRAYAQSHIPGAYYAHLDDDLSGSIIPGKTGRHPLPSVEAAAKLFSSWGIGPRTQVVAYDDMSGAIAARLWWMLRWLGHDQVAVLEGGWPAWQKAALPTDDQSPLKKNEGRFIAKVQNRLFADADFVEQVRLDPQYRVVDSRTSERYRGEKEPIDPIAGHIPGALNYPHPGNVTPDGNWLSSENLRTRFQNLLGDTPSENVIFYCGSGVTACRNLLAFKHAGIGEGKLYAGSWSEWITDPKREIMKME